MGCDCKIRLPENVRVQDVGELIGILLGIKPEKRVIDQCGAWSVNVPGLDIKGCIQMPGMCEIHLGGLTVGHPRRMFLYHFESSDGGRLLMPSSSGINIAIGCKLVDFFGGQVDYDDCDESDCDYQIPPKSRSKNSPEDGQEWQDFQERMFAVPALTPEFIERCREKAAYTED